MQPKSARFLLRFVGVVMIVCAALGFLYNVVSFYGISILGLDEVAIGVPVPYFYHAYYTMSLIAVVEYLILGWCGVQFLRLSLSLWWLFAAVSGVQVIQWILIGYSWRHAEYGASIAAATGVSGAGGLLPLLILLPLWGPITVWVARRSLLIGNQFK